MESLVKWGSKTGYYDENGEKCTFDNAIYKEVITIPGVRARLYKREKSDWKLLAIDTVKNISIILNNIRNTQGIEKKSLDADIQREINRVGTTYENETYDEYNDTNQISNTNLEAQEHVHDIVEEVYDRLKDDTKFTKEDLADYIHTCVWRNRKVGDTPVINIRLLDNLNQPIYIYDYGYKCSAESIKLQNIFIAESLDHVRMAFDKELKIDSMPKPIQWSFNPYDYIWNPSISISPISSLTIQSICDYQKDNFAPELQNKDTLTIIDEIKRNCKEEGLLACNDISYALPFYNKERDIVSMMLPLRVRILSGDKVLNALVFEKTPLGYSLYRILTVEEARKSVRLFRDPDLTWLKEV